MRPSDVKRLYYITHQDNLASIFRHGILSHNRVKAKGLKHQRIDNPDVNARRNITLPNGRNLHDYANLFFNCRNAMMYAKVLDPNGPGVNNLCVVGIDRSIVTQVEGVLASDINAAVEGRRIDH